jgi:hypothetical protein
VSPCLLALGGKGTIPQGDEMDEGEYERPAERSHKLDEAYRGQDMEGINHSEPRTSSRSSVGSAPGRPTRKWKSGKIIILVLLAVAAGLWYVASRKSNTSTKYSNGSVSPQTSGSGSAPIAKPSPIRREQPAQTQSSGTVSPVVQPQQGPIINPAQSQGTENSATLPPPTVSVVPPSFPFGVRMSANRDGMSNGCKQGVLIFEVSRITFTCPTDGSKSLAASASEVKNIDGNGIQLLSKQKYHFDIQGNSKDKTRDLFAQWLENARRGPSPFSN